MFKYIFRTTISELFDGVVPEIVINKAHEEIKKMCEAEIRWTKYVTQGVIGFSDRSIEVFIKGQANSICKNLNIPLLYEDIDERNNPLRALLKTHLPELEEITSRSGVFMNNSTQYVKSAVINDL